MDDESVKVAVILPAAGTGQRAETPTAKQYWLVESQPMIYYTLQTLEKIKWIQNITVPVSEKHAARMKDKISEWKFTKTNIVIGGTTRHRSIHAGLQSLLKGDDTHNFKETDIVIVHDAVRPFVDEATLLDVANAANQHGAAGTIIPLVSTVIKVDAEGFLDTSLNRLEYRASQTPQAFRKSVLERAYNKCTEFDFDHGTECLHLAQQYGESKVKLIEGSPSKLWKVTHQHDLFAAEQLLKKKLRRVALVTGATRGIGKATAMALANRGFKVAVLARTQTEVEQLAQEINGLAIVADVSDSDQVRAAFEKIISEYGSIDVVVNNAGQAVNSVLSETADEDWIRMMSCNLGGAFFCSREALKAMANTNQNHSGGIIINVGSSSVDGGRVGQGAYAMSKAGVHNLTETLALEGKPHGVLAYCVAPTRTYTTLRQTMAPNEGDNGCLKPEDVANAIVSIVMDANPHLTGTSFWLKYPSIMK